MSTYNVPIGNSTVKYYTRNSYSFNSSTYSEFLELNYRNMYMAYPCALSSYDEDQRVTSIQAIFTVQGSQSFTVNVYLFNGTLSTAPDVENNAISQQTISASSSQRNVSVNFTGINLNLSDLSNTWIVVGGIEMDAYSYVQIERTACTITYQTPAVVLRAGNSPVEAGQDAVFYFTNSLNHSYEVTVKANNYNIIVGDSVSYSYYSATENQFSITTETSWFSYAQASSSQMTVTVILNDVTDTSRTAAQTTFSLRLPTLSISKNKTDVTLERNNQDNFEGKITLSFSNRLNKTLSLTVKSGQTQLASGISAYNDSYELTCPYSWFTTLGSTAMSIQIRVDATDSYGRTAYITFNLKKPDFSISITAPSSSGDLAEINFIGKSNNPVRVVVTTSSTTLATYNVPDYSDYYNFLCYDSWFSGVTSNSLSITVTATDSTLQRTATASFSLTAGIGVYPSIGSITFENVPDPNMPSSYGYVAGYSKVKIKANNVWGGANAISSVKVSYSGVSNLDMTYRAGQDLYDATTQNVINGNMSFTVTVKDTTNRTATMTATLTGVETLPALSFTVNSASVTAGNDIIGNVSGFVSSYNYVFVYSSNTTLVSRTNQTAASFTETSESAWFTQVGATGSSISIRITITDVLGRSVYRDVSVNLPAFSVSVSPTQVTVGSNVTVTVTGQTDQDVDLVFSTEQGGQMTTFGTYSYNISGGVVNCPRSWFDNFTTINSMTVKVTASYGTKTATANFTLKYPDLGVSLNNNNIRAGGALLISIANRENETIGIALMYGNTGLATYTTTSNQKAVTVPASYFDTANVTTSKTMQISVVLVDNRGRSAITALTLNAVPSMAPTIDTITLSIVQPSPASETFPSTYIANVSKVKISASYVLSTNAGVQSVTLSYGSILSVPMTLNQTTNQYEATTANPITDDTEFTVTIVDVRNMSTSKKANLTGVEDYSIPSVTVNSFYRCNQDKTKNDAGEYCIVNVTYAIEPINNQNIKRATLSSTAYTDTRTLTTFTETVEYFFAVNMERSYEIVLTAIDAITSTSKTIRLSTAGVIMDFLRGGKGIGFGKVAETQNMVEVNPEWEFKGSVKVNGTLMDLGTVIASILNRL